MARMQLDDAKSRFARASGGSGKCRGHFPNQLRGHFERNRMACVERKWRWAKHLPSSVIVGERLRSLPRARHRRLAPGMGELNGGNGALLVDETRNGDKRIALAIIPQTGAILGDAAARLHVSCFDAHNAGTADGTCGKMGKMPVIDAAVVRRVLAHRRHHDAVANGYRTQSQRTEEMRIAVALKDAPPVFAGH